MLINWISAFRLRTLPLALSSIFMGAFLAFSYGNFRVSVFILACFTTLLLQILSNLANDYGDSVSGVDNENRVGPSRGVQSGNISRFAMKTAIVIFAVLSLFVGSWLILDSLHYSISTVSFSFFILGCGAILAAIKYTVGKNPYGYLGFGDFFVFIFFGIVGVCGSFYLFTHQFNSLILLPAISVGLLSVAVLNLNNLRDIVNDKLSNKNTLIVKIGAKKGKVYHFFLLFLPLILLPLYLAAVSPKLIFLLPLLALPIQIGNFIRVWKNRDEKLLDVELKRMALTTLLIVFIFGIAVII